MKLFKTLILKSNLKRLGGGHVGTQNFDVFSKFIGLCLSLKYFILKYKSKFYNEDKINKLDGNIDTHDSDIKSIREFNESSDIVREDSVYTAEKYRINVSSSLGDIIVIPNEINMYRHRMIFREKNCTQLTYYYG
ncbi:S-layer protein [Clostridium acetobutylicum]|nr:S-layer protein [Clostridium acetobutylicum]